jgi:hypothetical protein
LASSTRRRPVACPIAVWPSRSCCAGTRFEIPNEQPPMNDD